MAELFDRFAVDRVPRWPLLSRLMALSVVLHGLFFVVVAYVPTVQSIFHVAGSWAGVKMVERDYDRTLIGQRATLVNISKEPYEKLYYPTDYFGAPALPEEMTGPDALVVQQVQPPPPPAPVIIRPPRQRRAQAEPTPSPEEAEPTPSPSPEVADAEKKAEEEALNKLAAENNTPRPPAADELNMLPLKDVLKDAKGMLASGQLDLKDTIEVTVEADRKDDGRLENVVFRDPKGDPDAYLLAQKLVTALSESTILRFLPDTRHLLMSVKLDQQNVVVNVVTEPETEERAEQMRLGYSSIIGAASSFRKGTDEGELLNHMKVTREGKQVSMKFEMSRELAGAMLAKVKTTE
jgi:hypothetical protein